MRAAAAVAVSGVALILVALTFETATLFVPGVALVLIAAAVPAWIAVCARGANLRRTLLGERVVEGQPLEATIELRHGRLGVPGCEIVDPLAGHPLALRIAPVHLRAAVTELRIVARFERRGRRSLAAPTLRLQDPLGLVTIELTGRGEAQEVLVLPRIERPRSLRGHPSVGPRFGASTPSFEPLAAVEIDGLRAYQQGTPASRIHWPALARGAGLLERRLRADGGTGPLVVLDARCAHPDEQLDQAVRAAASLIHALARQGGCELLLPGDRRTTNVEPDLGAWPAAHARLALVEGGPDSPIQAVPPRPGSIFYVAADPAFGPLRHRLRPPQNMVIVVPAERAGQLHGQPILEVAGCVGVPVGRTGSGRAPAAAGGRVA